jgi:hypothetical protein
VKLLLDKSSCCREPAAGAGKLPMRALLLRSIMRKLPLQNDTN